MKIRIKFALAALTVGAACAFTAQIATGGSTGAGTAPLPLWQRVLQGGDLKGFTPAAVPPTILTLQPFVKQAADSCARITINDAYRRLKSAGFKHATISPLPHAGVTVASTVLELGSADQARQILRWAYADSLSPCPNACNVRIEPFHVPDIPGAVAVRRSRAKDAPSGPTTPFEAYDIEFTDGPFLYDLFAAGRHPGVFDKNDLIAAVTAQYERVKGHPALPG